MRGAGSAFFAVWGYVISHMKPNRSGGGTTVELNEELVAFLIGEEVEVVREQIGKMCAPDVRSRTKDEEGRKLVKLSEFNYRVVNGDYYRKIRNEDERREYQRVKQLEYRSKRAGKHRPLNGETEFVRALSKDQPDVAEGIAKAHMEGIAEKCKVRPDELRETPVPYTE